jgi:hypothetical protein
VLYSLPRLSDQGREGQIDDNIAAIENELQLALEEQEKSSPAGPSSSPRHRCSVELSHPPNDEEHDQSGAGYSRLEGLERDSPLYIQNRESAAEEEEDGKDDNTEWEQHGEERWYEDETEEISSGIRWNNSYSGQSNYTQKHYVRNYSVFFSVIYSSSTRSTTRSITRRQGSRVDL